MSSIVEITHDIRPLTPTMFDRYVDVHRERAVPFFERHGWELLGVWKWSTGPMGRYLTLLRVENIESIIGSLGTESIIGSLGTESIIGSLGTESIIGSLGTESIIGSLGTESSDDGVLTGLAAAMEGSGLTVSETVKVAEVVPFATATRLEDALESTGAADSPRQYMIARLGVTAAGRALAYELIAELADTFGARGRMQLVTAYQTDLATTGELTDLWVMDRLGDLSYRPSSPSALVDRLRTVAPDESIDYLNPLPHSPLR
jgi:hypothetical protein